MNVAIQLPEHWTVEQAEFLHDLVDLLHEAVWRQYGQALCEHWARSPSSRDLFDDEDVVPDQ